MSLFGFCNRQLHKMVKHTNNSLERTCAYEGGKKCYFFRKIRPLFSSFLFEIRPLALLPASGKELPSDALVKT